MCGEPEIGARTIGGQMELGHHAVHRVDLAAELRHEELVHHARRGEAKVHGSADRRHEAVHAGDALIRINEEPLPIECDDFDL